MQGIRFTSFVIGVLSLLQLRIFVAILFFSLTLKSYGFWRFCFDASVDLQQVMLEIKKIRTQNDEVGPLEQENCIDISVKEFRYKLFEAYLRPRFKIKKIERYDKKSLMQEDRRQCRFELEKMSKEKIQKEIVKVDSAQFSQNINRSSGVHKEQILIQNNKQGAIQTKMSTFQITCRLQPPSGAEVTLSYGTKRGGIQSTFNIGKNQRLSIGGYFDDIINKSREFSIQKIYEVERIQTQRQDEYFLTLE